MLIWSTWQARSTIENQDSSTKINKQRLRSMPRILTFN